MDQAKQQQQINQLLQSPQGKQLLKLLSRDGGAAMQRAGTALKQGNTQSAQAIMAPLMEDPEVQKLLKSLEQTMGHG